MKNKINSLLAYWGLKPAFAVANFNEAVKNFDTLIGLEQQAVSFVHGALSVAGKALLSEIKRNGFDPNDVRSGKLKLVSISCTSSKDPRFKKTIYSINGYWIMAIYWKVNGFTLEKNTMATINANKAYMVEFNGLTMQNTPDNATIIKNLNIDALTHEKLSQEKYLHTEK